MPDLRLSALLRGPLTDAETVRLGRVLGKLSAQGHVSFPDRVSTAVVIVHGCGDELPEAVRGRVEEVLGEFTQDLVV